jgi:hypothetical protein
MLPQSEKLARARSYRSLPLFLGATGVTYLCQDTEYLIIISRYEFYLTFTFAWRSISGQMSNEGRL